jgi:hypothetical protein
MTTFAYRSSSYLFYGTHSPAGEGVVGPNSDDWKKA